MGNRITNKRHPEVGDLKMSNGATSALIHVLVLEGSAMASSRREKELVLWSATRNQAVIGAGAVGFDLAEIPWSPDGFGAEKAFLLRTIDGAKSRQFWDHLDPQPTVEMLAGFLTQFRSLVVAFQKEDVDSSALSAWTRICPKEMRRCNIHGIYLMSWRGQDFDEQACLLCTDQ